MTVETRRISALTISGQPLIGAVQMADAVRVACPTGLSPAEARQAFATRLVSLAPLGRGMIAALSPGVEGDAPELDLLRGRNVLFGFRNGETAEAAGTWLKFHAEHHGADAALIFDRALPDKPGFAAALALSNTDLTVVVVQADMPLGLINAPDARDPGLAPAAPKRGTPTIDPWHAVLGEYAIFDLLRHRFLSAAQAVVTLDIADLLLPRATSVFDEVVMVRGQAIALRGRETYPWRLRQGKPAPHSDHIAVRREDRRRIIGWALSPKDIPLDAALRPGRAPRGVPVVDAPPVEFRRAMGVVYPGVPVQRLIPKAELKEDAGLVAFSKDVLKAKPVRMPAAAVISPRPRTGRVAVVTAMKNEGPFVLDWIAHNRVIGVDDHLVYTNDCEDGTERLLDALADAGVTRRDNPYRETDQVPQYAAFRAAEREAVVAGADWLLTLDVDEYINVHVGEGRLVDLFEVVPEAHVVSMPWRLFGNAHVTRFVDAPVTLQFTRAAPAFAPRPLHAWAFKSLFRNAGLFRKLGVHRPKGLKQGYQDQINWVDGCGRELPPSVWRQAWRLSKAHWGYDLVSVNHYAVRSAESYLVKRERGRVNHTTRAQDEAYWFRMNQNAEEELSIQRLAKSVAAEKVRLLSLPGVAEAHAESVAWYRGRVADLLQDAAYQKVFAEITSKRMERLSLMATYFGANVYMAGPHVIPDEVVARDPAEPFFFTVDPEVN